MDADAPLMPTFKVGCNISNMIKIAGCQPPEHLSDVPRNIATIIEFSHTAVKEGASLICFPECYLQGYIVEVARTRQLAISLNSERLLTVLKQLERIDATIVFGMIERDKGLIFNTAVVVKGGAILGTYRKSRLLANESKVFAPGKKFPTFTIDGVKFGINICNDLNFPECANHLAGQGVQLLVCPSNNMLPMNTAIKWKEKHNQIRAERCRESKVWLLSSDVTGERDGSVSYGPTAVISPSGCVVAQAPLEMPGLVIYEIVV